MSRHGRRQDGANVNGVVRRSTLRASDADREHIAERLRRAASEGRLLAEEFEQRLERALTARTYGELDPLVADLPAERLPASQSRAVTYLRPAAIALAVTMLVVAVLAVVALIVTGTIVLGGAWVFLLVWLFGARRGYHRGRYGRRGRLPRSAGFVPWL
jgi:Flp pilus assembly protein TadB